MNAETIYRDDIRCASVTFRIRLRASAGVRIWLSEVLGFAGKAAKTLYNPHRLGDCLDPSGRGDDDKVGLKLRINQMRQRVTRPVSPL